MFNVGGPGGDMSANVIVEDISLKQCPEVKERHLYLLERANTHAACQVVTKVKSWQLPLAQQRYRRIERQDNFVNKLSKGRFYWIVMVNILLSDVLEQSRNIYFPSWRVKQPTRNYIA